MHVVHRHFPRDYLNLMLHRNLTQYIPDTDSYFTSQNPFAVLPNPHQMVLQIRLPMSPERVTSHSDTYYLIFA